MPSMWWEHSVNEDLRMLLTSLWHSPWAVQMGKGPFRDYEEQAKKGNRAGAHRQDSAPSATFNLLSVRPWSSRGQGLLLVCCPWHGKLFLWCPLYECDLYDGQWGVQGQCTLCNWGMVCRTAELVYRIAESI
jgi:hypothetical protein